MNSLVGENEIKFDQNLPGIPERLLLAHAKGRVLFVAGAGVSVPKPSCLPNFRNLVAATVARIDPALGGTLRTIEEKGGKIVYDEKKFYLLTDP